MRQKKIVNKMQILQQQRKMNNFTIREVLKKTSYLSVRQNGSHVDLSYNLEAEIEVICIPGGLKNVFLIFLPFFVSILCQYFLSTWFANSFVKKNQYLIIINSSKFFVKISIIFFLPEFDQFPFNRHTCYVNVSTFYWIKF